MTDAAARGRIIAVEEHFLTNAYINETEQLEHGPGEDAERAFMAGFNSDPVSRRRLTDLEVRLQDMDASGTDVAVLSLNPPGVQSFHDGEKATVLAREMNDHLAEIIRARPGRFGGLASIAPQCPDQAALEVKRAVGRLGLGGVMINSHTLGQYLDEPQFEPILAAAEEENATIYLHPRVPSPSMLGPYSRYGMTAALWGFQAEAGTHAIRLVASGVFDRHPRLKIVLGHLGEGLPFWFWRLDNIHSKMMGWVGEHGGMVKLQRRPSEYLRTNFAITTSGMNDPEVLSFCLNKVGAENILFAIDYPYEESAVATRFIAELRLDDQQRALITHRNAERLFRIEATGPHPSESSKPSEVIS